MFAIQFPAVIPHDPSEPPLQLAGSCLPATEPYMTSTSPKKKMNQTYLDVSKNRGKHG